MNKLAVIIGAGPGLGLAIAKKFASQDFDIVLMARNEQSLQSMSDKIATEFGTVKVNFKSVDVSDAAQLGHAIGEVKKEYGEPDCVIYNVGITAPDSDNLTVDDLVRHFKTDVAGAYTAVKAFADDKFAEKKGAILFTGGGLAMYPADGFIPLSINKAALRTLAYILNGKYKGKGIFIGTVTVCGTIGGDAFFVPAKIADVYWQLYKNRDKCEYVYQYPGLAPDKIYNGKTVEYGIFEENAGNYWGQVYSIMNENNKK